jgi:hypothetical protein
MLENDFRRFISANQGEGRLRPSRRGLALGLPLWERPGEDPSIGVFVRTTRAPDDEVLASVLRGLGRVVGRPADVAAPKAVSRALQSSMTIPWGMQYDEEQPAWETLWKPTAATVWLLVTDSLQGLQLPARPRGKAIFAVVLDSEADMPAKVELARHSIKVTVPD